MKGLFRILCTLLILFFLTGFARAEEGSEIPEEVSAQAAEEISPQPPTVERQAEALELDKVQGSLPQEAGDVLQGLSPTEAGMGDKGLERLWKAAKEDFFGIFKSALSSALKIVAVLLLSTAASSAMGDGAPKEMVRFGTAVSVSAVAISNVNSFIGLGVETLYRLSDYSKALLPVMCTAATSAGAFTSAAAKYAATALFLDVLIGLATNLIMPLISIYLVSVVANAILEKDRLGNVSKLLKWACTTSLTLLVTGFVAYLGMAGLISGKADQMAARVTKTALGTALPVVGGILADTAETLVAGAGILRNAVGIFGLLAVAAVCLLPFLKLGLHYLVYKGTAAFAEALADKRLAELISDVGTAFGMVLALVGAGGIMLFVSVISSMKAVTAL